MSQTKDAPPTILMIELDDDTRPILKKKKMRSLWRVVCANPPT
jgi:hypothetical protein